MPADTTLEIPLSSTPLGCVHGPTELRIVDEIAATHRWASEPVAELESLARRLADAPGTLSTLRAVERMRLSGIASGHVPARSTASIEAGRHSSSTRAFVRRFGVASRGASALSTRTRTARRRIMALALDAAACPATREEAYAVKLEADRAREALSMLSYRAQRARGRLIGLLRRVPPAALPGPGSCTQEIPLGDDLPPR